MDNKRLYHTLKRHLTDLTLASWEWRIILSFKESAIWETTTFNTFPEIVQAALFSNYQTRLMRTFEKRVKSDSATFWFVYNICRAEMTSYIELKGIDFRNIEEITAKLLTLRDKHHFHRDKKYISKPGEIFKEANINLANLKKAVDDAFDILAHLYKQKTGDDFSLGDYDGCDAFRIMHMVQRSRTLYDMVGPLSDFKIADIRPDSIWIMTNHGDIFIHFNQYPEFNEATISEIYNIQSDHKKSLFWPDLKLLIQFDSLSTGTACCPLKTE